MDPSPPSDDVATSLSFVVPFWNEEDGASRCLQEVCAAADAMTTTGVGPIEVIAVDDGSTDRTPTILADLARADPRIRVVTHEVNQGLGAALRSGLGAVATEWAFYTDADLPVRPEVALDALRVAIDRDLDLVSGARTNRRDGVRRSAMSTGFNVLVRLALNLPVRDVNAPAKLIRQRFIAESLPLCDSPLCDAELLARALRSGARIDQIDVVAYPRLMGTSSLSSPAVVLAVLWDLARHGPELRVRRDRRA